MSVAPTPGTGSRSGRGAPPAKVPGRAVGMLVLCVLLVTGGVVVEAVALDRMVTPPEPVPQEPARAGVWYCPAVAGEEEAATVTVAAVGDEAARVTLVRYEEQTPDPDEPVDVEPGTSQQFALEAGRADTPVAVRWEGGPAVASWRKDGSDTAGATCEATPSEQWHFAGFDTAGGTRSVIHLFNPFTVDAVARVTFATPEGRIALVLTDNVVVEAGGVTRVSLNEFQPEEPDLGVTVEVLTGRMVAVGEMVFRPPGEDPGPRGRTLVPPVTAAGTEWALGYVGADERTASYLSVMNLGEREAAVEVRVTDPAPDSPLAGEVSVPAGGVVRVDMESASEAALFGAAVSSVNEEPVVVARVTTLATEDGRQGIAASAGGHPATRQAVVGGGADERTGRVVVFNPGTEPVDIVASAGPGTPPEWDGMGLGPNEIVVLDLGQAGAERGSTALVVESSGPVTAELRSTTTGERLQPWTALGVPASVWTGPPTRPPVRRDQSLVTSPLPPEPPEPDELRLDDVPDLPTPEPVPNGEVPDDAEDADPPPEDEEPPPDDAADAAADASP